jgi:RNA polymerase sigma-70 factor (ECF subfamily)
MKKVKQNQSVSPDVRDFINLVRQQSVLKSSRLLDHETFIRAFKGKETSDAELIAAYNLNHNGQAFDELYNRYKSRMLGYLYGILHNWEDAKDVLHDSWEAALLFFTNGRYIEKQDFAGWFKGICYHRASEWKRERQRFFYSNERLPDHVDASLNAEEQLENRQCELLLQKAVNGLPEGEKQVILLRIYRSKSFYEIAVIRNITVSAARGVYCRALKKLRSALD